MLSLAHVHIRRKELVCMSRRGSNLQLVLDWPTSDLPVLIDLPERSELRFGHLAGEDVGVPVRLTGWDARGRGGFDRLAVLLYLTFLRDDGGPPTTP